MITVPSVPHCNDPPGPQSLFVCPHPTCWSRVTTTAKQICQIFFFFPSFFNFSFTLLSYIHLLEDKVWSLCLCRSALQVLHKACEVSRRFNYFPGGIALTWMAFYESCITSEQSCVNEWNAMTDLETTRPDSPTMFVDR